MEPNLIEFDTVVLDDSIASSGQAFPLSSSSPNIVRGWRVEIRGIAKTTGTDVTIVANQVVFFSGGLIDVSGIDAPAIWAAGNKPLTPDTPGTRGHDGSPGKDGTNAGNVTIIAASVSGTINVRAVGGAGGRGQDGGDGSTGAPGANASNRNGVWNNCPPPAGSPGGRGGQGGSAGIPGKSGNGGNLDIWLPSGSKTPSIQTNLAGGRAAQQAASGNPGQGGPGGRGAYCESLPSPSPVITQIPRIGPILIRQGPGQQGAPGSVGSQADPQTHLSSPGSSGLLNGQPATTSPLPANHVLADSVFGAQCSVQQLWHVLATAEQLYLNDQFTEAVPRLTWISAIARLLPQPKGNTSGA